VRSRSTISRWLPGRWTGGHRRDQDQNSRRVPVEQHATELAALLTAGLSTQVVLRAGADGTALFLLDADGQSLRSHRGDRQASKDRRELKALPFPVAIIFSDSNLWYAPDLPVMVHIEAVSRTSVGSGGQHGHTVSDAATHIIRHAVPVGALRSSETSDRRWIVPIRE
jgi:hypothetical protein